MIYFNYIKNNITGGFDMKEKYYEFTVKNLKNNSVFKEIFKFYENENIADALNYFEELVANGFFNENQFEIIQIQKLSESNLKTESAYNKKHMVCFL